MHPYKHDVFISYAHLDNELTGGAGRITLFHRDLDTMLSTCLGRPAIIWRDDQLTVDDDFNSAIMDALNNSAVLVIVMSPTFIERDWFQKEFSAFGKAAQERGGAIIDGAARTFNVMIRTTPLEKMPLTFNSYLAMNSR